MSLDEGVSNLIKRIYIAQQDPERWDNVALELMSRVGASVGRSTVVDLSNRDYNQARFYGSHDTKFAVGVDEFRDVCGDDPSLIWASQNPTARFCDSSKTVVGRDYLSHPFVQWNYAHFGSTHWYVGYTPPSDQLSYSFSVHFPSDKGAASEDTLTLFRMLFDHMECAIGLSRRPFNPNSDRALLLLDSGGWVRQLSTGATKLLALPDGLKIVDRRLKTIRACEQAALDLALKRVASACLTGAACTAVQISRASGKRPYILTIRPLINVLGPFGKVHCELLIQIHSGIPQIGSLELLQSLFDLTARELQVVRLMADGHSVETLARCMVISTNTARTHLRAIFAKTQTGRQSELLRLCAGLAAA